MKIEIQSPGIAISQQLENFVKEVLHKLFHVYKEIISIEVCLTLDSSSTRENKNCRLRSIVPGNDILSSAQSRTFEEAIVQSAKALEKQLNKRKSKMDRKAKNMAKLYFR